MKYTIAGTFLIFLLSRFSFAQDPMSAVINRAVLVKFNNGSSGSGLFIQDSLYHYFVTAKHVIVNTDNNSASFIGSIVELSTYSNKTDSSKVIVMNVDLQKAHATKNIAISYNRDMAIIRLGKVRERMIDFFNFVEPVKVGGDSIITITPNQFAFFKQTKVTTDVFVIGFPKSLGMPDLPQFDFNNPILRKGIIAGKNFENRTIVLDCLVFPGNSGGPVMQASFDNPNMKFIGIILEFVPFVESWQNNRYNGLSHQYIINSGYSIVEPVDTIIELIKTFR